MLLRQRLRQNKILRARSIRRGSSGSMDVSLTSFNAPLAAHTHTQREREREREKEGEEGKRDGDRL